MLSFLIFHLIFFGLKLIISTRTLHLQISFWIHPIRLILSSYCLVWSFLWTYSIIAGVYNFEQYWNRVDWYKKHDSFILFLSSMSNTTFKNFYFKTPSPDSFLEFPFMPIGFVGHYRILMHTWYINQAIKCLIVWALQIIILLCTIKFPIYFIFDHNRW